MSAFEFAAGPGAPAWGFGTPASDTRPQIWHVPPRRVIPIVFLPGIMGSNLRITKNDRLERLGRKPGDKKGNIAWRPDTFGAMNASAKSNLTPAERQLMLDPETTAVDVYNADSKASAIDGDKRHRNVELSPNFSSPLLMNDAWGDPNAKTTYQKARMRGWGEVYFGSYGKVLQRVEARMQRVFFDGKLGSGWDEVIGVDPKKWHLDPSTPQQALTIDELKAITKDTFFPVYAIGYNWLVSNRKNASTVAVRVRQIVEAYRTGADCKFDCPGVIVVTHSMGGLLGRALVHPDMGGLNDLVLGIVHGVQPATGAAVAYRRMRAGFEDPHIRHPLDSIGARIAGNYGDEVTAVLANSPGALQLLPSKAYGKGWLRVRAGDRELSSLPARGDPYEEIYKVRGKWYGLIANESWINPAQISLDDDASPVEQAHKCIDAARQFHELLGDSYHANTYAHYGADRNNLAFGNVTWQIRGNPSNLTEWKNWQVVDDNRQGTVFFTKDEMPVSTIADPLFVGNQQHVSATLDEQDEPGDQTVPMRSADRPKDLGKCKAVFRQTGYDHQDSYKNESALAATLYSILRIAQRV